MGAMLSVPAPKSIAGMARSYNPWASVGAPWARCLPFRPPKSIAGMARSYRCAARRR